MIENYKMSMNRHFRFQSSTFPLVFCCLVTWFLDRLFVEFGHRATSSPICIHNDLQYVLFHRWLTALAVVGQTVYACRRRRDGLTRELVLIGSSAKAGCLCHLYMCQATLALGWTTILACALDFSPWLCVSAVLDNRASLITIAFCVILFVYHLERCLYDRTLQARVPGI
tara:strand:+ start:783 stop:1292 length:510 start_codon:yes stop_codon:yes gene_type:complete